MGSFVTTVLGSMWYTSCDMAPYLLFGFFVAGLLSIALSPEFVERHLGGSGPGSILKAALLGIPLPLCSCGVIPVAAGLRSHGASRAATTAFLISTPQTGVDSLLVTYSLLGPVVAIVRPIAALLSGFLGGVLVMLAAPFEPTTSLEVPQPSSCSDHSPAASPLRRALRHGFVTLPRDIGGSLVVGLVIAGLIAAVLPADFFARFVGNRALSMVAMLLCGIPLYVCATASVPIAAALVAKGVSPGAALVFLMTGPATNAAALATIDKILGRRTAVLFLVAVAVSAVASGLVLDMLISTLGTDAGLPTLHVMPTWLGPLSALVLFGMLGYATWGPGETAESPGTILLAVEGMRCSHCEATVVRALCEVPGVTSARADACSGRAYVEGTVQDVADLVKAIERVGHSATTVVHE